MGSAASAAFCVSRGFRDLFWAQDKSNARPFMAWLLELMEWVSETHSGARIGVVGMCLTGGYAIAAIAKPQVEAVAACQPSAPFVFKIATLGLSDKERDCAKQGKPGKEFLA